MALDDENLVDRAVHGDVDALSQLLERYGPEVRGRLASDIPAQWQSLLAADDVLQQTCVDAFLDVRHFASRGPGSFQAWLMTLAKRNLVDALRMLEAEKRGQGARRLQPRTTDGLVSALYGAPGRTRSTPSRYATRQEARDHLQRAIQILPPAYRTVVEMYDLEGRPAAEVARALRRSPGAVFMLRSRAHRLLRETLGPASRYLSDSA